MLCDSCSHSPIMFAEYEAMIHGLHIAVSLRVKRLMV
jgi:hypothetical protein